MRFNKRWAMAMSARPGVSLKFMFVRPPTASEESCENDTNENDTKPMKVLVTGGAGYIGSVVVEELLLAGHQVVVLDNLSRGNRQAVPPQAELVVGDLADRPLLDQLLRVAAINAVMHFAALIEAGESMKAPGQFFRNNTANALTLLEATLVAKVTGLYSRRRLRSSVILIALRFRRRILSIRPMPRRI